MPGADLLLPFFLTVLLLSVTPGPGMLYMAAQTIGRGRKAGWFAAIGTHIASYVHILAAAFGVSLVLATVPAAFVVVKLIGAAYLVWLGIRFLTSADPDAGPAPARRTDSHVRALKESVLVELTNPKSALFFLAFLPQFADPAAAAPIWLQILGLGVVANIVFSLAEAGVVVFADTVALAVRRSQAAGRWMRRLAGSILITLGLGLLVSER